jgi:hypothetical protein
MEDEHCPVHGFPFLVQEVVRRCILPLLRVVRDCLHKLIHLMSCLPHLEPQTWPSNTLNPSKSLSCRNWTNRTIQHQLCKLHSESIGITKRDLEWHSTLSNAVDDAEKLGLAETFGANLVKLLLRENMNLLQLQWCLCSRHDRKPLRPWKRNSR